MTSPFRTVFEGAAGLAHAITETVMRARTVLRSTLNRRWRLSIAFRISAPPSESARSDCGAGSIQAATFLNAGSAESAQGVQGRIMRRDIADTQDRVIDLTRALVV